MSWNFFYSLGSAFKSGATNWKPKRAALSREKVCGPQFAKKVSAGCNFNKKMPPLSYYILYFALNQWFRLINIIRNDPKNVLKLLLHQFVLVSRAAQTQLAGDMWPANRVFETPALNYFWGWRWPDRHISLLYQLKIFSN